MTAEEIRREVPDITNEMSAGEAQVFMLNEIAAQLAELNATLKERQKT